MIKEIVNEMVNPMTQNVMYVMVCCQQLIPIEQKMLCELFMIISAGDNLAY